MAVVGKPTDPEVLLAEVKKLLPKFFNRVMDPNPPPTPKARTPRHKILVVDDDTCILELYKEILSKAGFEIQTAEDAMAAVSKYQDFKPALVILDVDMPAGGGRKVFERLRVQFASVTPVIFSTASPEAVAGLEKDLDVIVLKKPLTPDILTGAAKKLLKMA